MHSEVLENNGYHVRNLFTNDGGEELFVLQL